MSVWQAKVEANTLATAKNHRSTWTSDDLEFVAAFRDEATDEELAIALGRSYFAIASIKRELDERMTKSVEERTVSTQRREKGWTFVGDDVPPGWW